MALWAGLLGRRHCLLQTAARSCRLLRVCAALSSATARGGRMQTQGLVMLQEHHPTRPRATTRHRECAASTLGDAETDTQGVV
jgi:hypothetical protein